MLQEKYREPPTTLGAAASAVWGEIVDERFLFDRKEQQARALDSVDKASLLALYDNHLAPKASAR